MLTLSGHSSEIQSVAFSPDGHLLATGGGDNVAKVWDVATGTELLTLPGSLGGVTGVAFHPGDGSAQLAVASSDGVVGVFVLELDELVALAKSRLTRTMTEVECRRYLHLPACPAADGAASQ